ARGRQTRLGTTKSVRLSDPEVVVPPPRLPRAPLGTSAFASPPLYSYPLPIRANYTKHRARLRSATVSCLTRTGQWVHAQWLRPTGRYLERRIFVGAIGVLYPLDS